MGMELWCGDGPLVLASASPARRALLEGAGLPVEVEPSGVDEAALQARLRGASPAAIAGRLAEAKALAVSARRPDRLVVGADQVVDVDGQALGKPADLGAASRHLAALSGRSHELVSAVAVAREGAILHAFDDRARLAMRRLDGDSLDLYLALAGDAVTRSAGGYEIEGLGIHLFERIEGAHETILGLPLLPLLPLLSVLRRLGLLGL